MTATRIPRGAGLLAALVAAVVMLGTQVPAGAATWPRSVAAPIPIDSFGADSGALLGMSCTSFGNCVATGWNQTQLGTSPMVLVETSGTWSGGTAPVPPIHLPSTSATRQVARFNAITCTSVGNCVAVGTYSKSSGREAGLIATEVSGKWRRAIASPTPAGAPSTDQYELHSVSCPKVGDCVAVGSIGIGAITSSATGYIVTESSGAWTKAAQQQPPSDAKPVEMAGLSSVSCPAVGACTSVGSYSNVMGLQGWIVTQSAASWSSKRLQSPRDTIPRNGLAAMLSAISCPTKGNCVVAGMYQNAAGSQLLVATEATGRWHAGVKVNAPSGASVNPLADFTAISCTSTRTCVAVGQYADSAGNPPLTATESNGTWPRASGAPVPSDANTGPVGILRAVACVTGRCSAVGNYEGTGNAYAMIDYSYR